MALGDGIRRNIATVSAAERARLRDAIVQLHQRHYPGGRGDTPTGGVSWWFKQDEIHAHSHVHGCPAFVPWHREMMNRFEVLIRQVDPQLSLHYWDWTQDPQAAPDGLGGTVNLFTVGTAGNAFMGSASGEALDPWRAAGFYDPSANPSRSDSEFDPNNNPFDPPLHLTRNVQPGGAILPTADQACVNATDFPSFDSAINSSHGTAHGHIGGTLGDQHTSFRDPFVFLMHSNLDRIFARWQLQDPDHRLDPSQLYGAWSNTIGSGDVESGAPQWGILSPLEPWAGPAAQTATTGVITNVHETRPWATPENEQNLAANEKDSKHPTVVKPPCYDTNPTIIQALNPGNVINFNDVPAGETTLRSATFRFVSCIPLTFRVSAGPNAPYTVFSTGGQIVVSPSDDIWTVARLWFSFTGSVANTAAPNSSVTIHCNETGQDFVFTLTGNTIARPTVAVMLALDQSGSMDDPAGNTGVRRIQALREAGSLFADIIQPGNAVGVIRFDTVAYPVNDPTYPGLAVTTIGNAGIFDPGRTAVRNAINAHATNPNGATSIGAGVQLARNDLNPVVGFTDKALIVFTDGLENTAPMIADVLGDVDQRTFAIGLGNAQQVSSAALTALTNGTGGDLLLTGLLSSSTEDYFLLSKYFLQILAGVTNTDIVKDPAGFITHGAVVTVPFVINETDIEVTVALLTDIPAVDLYLETPSGATITAASAPGVGVTFADAGTKRYYRFTLPVAIGPGQQAGTWKAILKLNDGAFRKYCGGDLDKAQGRHACPRNGVRYSVSAMTWSNLRMSASLHQGSMEPGGTMTVRAKLDEYGIPVEHRASLAAALTLPDGSTSSLAMVEVQPGTFEGSVSGAQSGVYRFHVLATGVTIRGAPFTREKLLTGALFQGGNNPLPKGISGGSDSLCCLLQCLLKDKSVIKFLEHLKLDVGSIGHCVSGCCAKKMSHGR
jgi:Common central domain of tyrosinase/von Willebrand factor type A domain